MVIGQDRAGQFVTVGTLQGQQVRFVVNRTQRETVIPLGLMKNNMTKSCSESARHGNSERPRGCIGYAESLVFGVFALPRIPAVFIETNSDTVSVGADVMAGFEVEQTETMMLIRSRHFSKGVESE